MRTIFSTDGLPARDRLSYWLDVVCKEVVVHDEEPLGSEDFNADISVDHIADLAINIVNLSPTKIIHRKEHISRSSPDDLLVCRILAGPFLLEQDQREAVVQQGEFTLLDLRLPYKVRVPLGS